MSYFEIRISKSCVSNISLTFQFVRQLPDERVPPSLNDKVGLDFASWRREHAHLIKLPKQSVLVVIIILDRGKIRSCTKGFFSRGAS